MCISIAAGPIRSYLNITGHRFRTSRDVLSDSLSWGHESDGLILEQNSDPLGTESQSKTLCSATAALTPSLSNYVEIVLSTKTPNL